MTKDEFSEMLQDRLREVEDDLLKLFDSSKLVGYESGRSYYSDEKIKEQYKRGFYDAWGTLMEIAKMSYKERAEVASMLYDDEIGTPTVYEVMVCYDTKEETLISDLEKYEEKKYKEKNIVVGDIVKVHDRRGLVTNVNTLSSDYVDILFEDGTVVEYKKSEVEVQGKIREIRIL